jgi:hypothetical protein
MERSGDERGSEVKNRSRDGFNIGVLQQWHGKARAYKYSTCITTLQVSINGTRSACGGGQGPTSCVNTIDNFAADKRTQAWMLQLTLHCRCRWQSGRRHGDVMWIGAKSERVL